MFDNWINKPGNTIDIKFLKDKFQARNSLGILEIDPLALNGLSYINNFGTAVTYTFLGALVHEFGHALSGKKDPVVSLGSNLTDYQDTNIPFINDIWSELTFSGVPDLDLMISYTGTGDSNTQKVGYAYTNNQPIIDVAIDVDYLARNRAVDVITGWNTSVLGKSNDLLIGGYRKNILESGAGNDFLFGGGGNDILKGGAGIDTAVYLGNQSDYDIRKNTYFKLDGFNYPWKWDGTWTVSHVRGAKDDDGDLINYAGTDKLENIEFLQFDNAKKYDLKTAGLNFQSDFALVIDTTGSMGSSINSVKAQASSLIDALFADGQDSRIGVVSFKDTANGEPTQVILPFTEQNEFTDRKAAAIAAINSLTVGGGGDLPETDFDGLRTALNGSMGQWRAGAGTLRIALFTDAPVKDEVLASEVTTLAQSIGAMVGSSSAIAGAGGSVNTFNLTFGSSAAPTTSSSVLSGLTGVDESDVDPIPPFVPSDEPIDPDPTTAQVQIFTIFTGPAGTDTAALSQIANANGGAFSNLDRDQTQQ